MSALPIVALLAPCPVTLYPKTISLPESTALISEFCPTTTFSTPEVIASPAPEPIPTLFLPEVTAPNAS